MANKLKKSITPKAAAEKPEKTDKAEKTPRAGKKTDTGKFRTDREEKLDLKAIAKDERTWKILGTVSLLASIFLFIAFVSYLFTWKEDQSQVMNKGISFLFDNDEENKVTNLLGRLGAYTSHNLIHNGFGLSSFLFCTFFFVVGINLLFNRKVFSIWRNLKYVTIGLLIVSVSLSFMFSSARFPFGGEVGDMISNWLVNFLGTIGTAALLLVVGGSYLIWQFNPSFNVPIRQARPEGEEAEPLEDKAVDPETTGATLTINDRYSEKEPVPHSPNLLKGEGQMVVNGQAEETDLGLQLTEKDDPAGALTINQPVIEKEIVADMLHEEEAKLAPEPEPEPEPVPVPAPRKQPVISVEDLELEIKTAEEKTEEEEGLEKGYSDLPPYEPTLDLRDYKYPRTDLLETHGSEKIVQDPAELEANKNQIINTLKNYDINIQKISATVGPTVTLYEMVPLPGIGAMIRIPSAARLNAISSSRFLILEIRTPAAGTIS